MVLGFGKKEQEGVGCYGKLPLHGDYVSHQVDGREASRFASWLNEGYRLTRGNDDPDSAETRFVFPGRGKRVLFGTMWPSRDSSGTRRFPFTVFATVGAKRLTYLEAQLPLALAPVWKAMSDAMPSVREEPRVDAVQNHLAGIQVPEFPDPKAMRMRFDGLAGGAEVSDGVRDTLFDVIRLTAALAPGKKGNIPAFAIRLELCTGLEPELEASMWLAMLAKGLGENALPGMSHVFLRPSLGDSPGELFVYHRELKPEDMGFVLTPVPDYPYVNSLGTHGDLPEAAAFREWCDEHLGPSASVTKVIEADYGSAF